MESFPRASEMLGEGNKELIQALVNLVDDKNDPDNGSLCWTKQKLLRQASKKNIASNQVTSILNSVFCLEPNQFGIHIPEKPNIPQIPPITNLIKLPRQEYRLKDGKSQSFRPQFISTAMQAALTELNAQMQKDIQSRILVCSGYRSPIYQALVFLHYLINNEFDLAKTGQRVALPMYSEHSAFPYHAIDIGLPVDYDSKEELVEREEYKWMLANANQFGLHMSYPENNLIGYEFEPWHWRLILS